MKNSLLFSVGILGVSLLGCEVQPVTEPPTHKAASVTFVDTDGTDGIGGEITITRAADESDIDSYVIRWGDSSYCNTVYDPIVELPIPDAGAGTELVFVLPQTTIVPDDAESFLVYSKNSLGEMEDCTGNVYANIDNYVEVATEPPQNLANSVTFVDSDPEDTIGGQVLIERADDESDITHYILRWGLLGHCNAANSLIAEIPKTGADVTYNLPSGTDVPGAVYELLVYTKNAAGEMANCIDNVHVGIDNYIEPDPTPPIHTATSVSFTDDDGTDAIGGTVEIGRAVDESDITHYVLRWGLLGHCNAANSFIAEIPVTGDDITYQISMGTDVPVAVYELLVYSKNDVGEMANCSENIHTDIDNYVEPDPEPPLFTAEGIQFTDTDPEDSIGGPVVIEAALDESDVTHYVLRWGLAGHCNAANSFIAEIPVTGADISYELPQGTDIPVAVYEILVYTKNSVGEMANCIDNQFVSIDNYIEPDPIAPVHAPSSVSFTDTDGGPTIGGTITIGAAADESDITHYVLRWGLLGHCNAANSYIGEVAATGGDVTFELPQGTNIPGAVYEILAYSKNDVGETANCSGNANTSIDNLREFDGAPNNKASSISFTDTDGSNKIGGPVTIGRASDESDITYYSLHWALAGSSCKAANSHIATVAATGDDLVFELPQGTSIPFAVYNIAVYTGNPEGEMASCQGVYTKVR